jgi:hypothetical protein
MESAAPDIQRGDWKCRRLDQAGDGFGTKRDCFVANQGLPGVSPAAGHDRARRNPLVPLAVDEVSE